MKGTLVVGGLVLELERYRDEGCVLHPSCLDCPRPVCVYDEPPQKPGPKGPHKENT